MNYLQRRHGGWYAAIAVASVLMTAGACGSTAAASWASSPTTSCPVTGPAFAGPQDETRRPAFRPGAVTAIICQYEPSLTGIKAASAPLRRLILRGQLADGLRAVLAGTEPMTPQASRCDRANLLPVVQVIYLAYRDGRTARAVVTFTSCQLAVLTAGGRSGLLPSPVQDDLFGYALVLAHDRGPLVPDVVGLREADAAAEAARHHFTLTVDAEAIDPAVPSGTIIFQVLPPGVPDAGPSPYSVGTIVSVHLAPDCRAGQLRLDYRDGGLATGNDFGQIMVRDVAAAPCRLAGQLQLSGVDAAGRPVTSTISAAIAGPGVLEPDMAPVPDGSATPSGMLAFLLSAEYRDDPTSPDGLCLGHYVIPARWRARLPSGPVILVPNADSGSPFREHNSSGGLVTCRGRLGAMSQETFPGQPR